VRKRATCRDDVLDVAERCGWRVVSQNKKGYLQVRCGCGQHYKWVHKTPSNPNYWDECARKIHRDCCPADEDGHEEDEDPMKESQREADGE
jgi:hypothetical protein